jgi:hypothetical protein
LEYIIVFFKRKILLCNNNINSNNKTYKIKKNSYLSFGKNFFDLLLLRGKVGGFDALSIQCYSTKCYFYFTYRGGLAI